MTNVVIAGYARSPFHRPARARWPASGPTIWRRRWCAAWSSAPRSMPADIEDLIARLRLPGRRAGAQPRRGWSCLLAGLPLSVAGTTVNRFCGSSMQSIHMAAGAIALGAGEVFICAGVESMSRVPMGGFNPMPNPALAKADARSAYIGMGDTAENVAAQIADQPRRAGAFAVAQPSARRRRRKRPASSTTRSCRSQTARRQWSTDGCIRPDTTAEGLAGLKPAFDANGTVTAGTSSPLTDGAAAVLVCSEEYAKKHGLKPLARIRAIAVAGCAPEIMGIGPVAGDAEGARSAPGSTLEDIDVIELNEAFASQSLPASMTWASTERRSISTAARSRSAIRSAPPARASPARRRRCSSAKASKSRWRRSASAAARASPPCSRPCDDARSRKSQSSAPA